MRSPSIFVKNISDSLQIGERHTLLGAERRCRWPGITIGRNLDGENVRAQLVPMVNVRSSVIEDAPVRMWRRQSRQIVAA